MDKIILLLLSFGIVTPAKPSSIREFTKQLSL